MTQYVCGAAAATWAMAAGGAERPHLLHKLRLSSCTNGLWCIYCRLDAVLAEFTLFCGAGLEVKP